MSDLLLSIGVLANVVTAFAHIAIGIYVAPKFNLTTMASRTSRVAKACLAILFVGTGLTTLARAWFMTHPMETAGEWTRSWGTISFFGIKAIAAVVFLALATRHLSVKVFDRKAHERVLEDYLIELEALAPPVNAIDMSNPEHASWIEMFNEAIHGDIMEPVFQPIVNLNTQEVVGYEALTRFHGYPDVTTEQWFIAATRFGMEKKLEVAAARKAIEADGDLPTGTYMTINVSQETFLSLDLVEALTEMGLLTHRFVLELTEHVATVRYKPLQDASEVVRHVGIKVAVDDVGSGFASMRRVIELKPEIIKVDKSLSHDIVASEHQQALVRSLLTYARDMNTMVVVEGVETEGQVATLRKLGVRFGQGYYFGRPQPFPRP